MGDISNYKQPDLAILSDEEQVMMSESTDNGPQSKEDQAKTAELPQQPGSAVK